MSKRTLLALCCTGFLSVPAFAVDQAKPGCCAKPAKQAAATADTAEKLRCSLTGKVVDKCCCVERDGKRHCTLADKDVEKCCCSPAKPEQAK